METIIEIIIINTCFIKHTFATIRELKRTDLSDQTNSTQNDTSIIGVP